MHYSAMVQRITKTYLKPDIGCFVLFDGGFRAGHHQLFSRRCGGDLRGAYMLSMEWHAKNWQLLHF